MIINQANLVDLFRAYNAAFNAGFRSAETWWARVATPVPSATRENHYGWLGQFPKLREWIGDRQIKSMAAHGYAITNRKFEGTVAVPAEDIEDDTYGVFTPMMQEMGYSAATHPDELVFDLLAAGRTTLCYDGQNFFDTDHPVGGASVANLNSGGAGAYWYLLDVSRPLKPLIFQRRRDYRMRALTEQNDEQVFMADEYRYGVDARVNAGFGFWQQAYASNQALDATNYAAARAAMAGFKSDEGRPLGIRPTLLVVPPSLEGAALNVTQAERLANGQTNIYRNTAETVVVPWLS